MGCAATPDTRHFLATFKRFQEAQARIYSVDETVLEKDLLGDPALLQQVRDTAFRTYRTMRTASFRDAPPLEGDFPVVIYHQGLGGTMEENQLVLELLASHGYIAVGSGFQHPEADMSLYAGNVSATLDDLLGRIAGVVDHGYTDRDSLIAEVHALQAENG